MEEEKKYFIILYSEDGEMAARVSPLWNDYSRTEKFFQNFSHNPLYEIGNTEDDKELAEAEMDCWIDLLKPRF